jgi:uncharacterized phage protein (TIGR02218 family)
MRTISAALEAHLAGETTTLATLWKVTRTDARVFGFTDHDRDLGVGGVTYRAETGYTRSAVRASLGLAVDNLEVQGVLDAPDLTVDEIRAGKWDYATVEVMLVNWADVSMGTLTLTKGKMGHIRAGRSSFTAELRGMSQHLQQPIGRLYMPSCDADLGDSRCGINLASFTVTGTVTGVTSKRAFADTGRTEADGYFDGGKLTWLTGNNTGLSMEVKTFINAGGALTLQLPMSYHVQPGDTYSLSAGCDKSFATCKAKFSNGVNFQGFPHLPGLDWLMRGGHSNLV